MYKADIRDIHFALMEWSPLDRVLALPGYGDWDRETFAGVLDAARKMAEGLVAPLNETADREGCRRHDDGRVTTPEAFKAAYQAYCEAGWIALTTAEEHGGQNFPITGALAVSEMFTAASTAFLTYPGLTHAASGVILERGTPAQVAAFVPKMLTGEWTGTMCLTEPQAGSAVGDASTMATPIDGRPGWYTVKGTKIFITAGDHDLARNIVHLVLARTPGAKPGIRGLSLLIVPKYKLDAQGEAGELNDVLCPKIEEKMGLHGSTTAVLNFGDADGCEGWIIGAEGEGIKHMFQMMNEARLGVGIQSLSVAAAAYHEALEYSKQRVQGVRITEMRDPNAKRVAIVEHPDVKRMLLIQRAYVTGLRALVSKTGVCVDVMHRSEDAEEKDKARRLVEILTPLCKGYGSDQAFECTRWALQCFGGYGYVADYPAERYMRDSKIFSLYEGTNGIQALDLLGRKLGAEGGALYMTLLAEIQGFVAAYDKHPGVADYLPELADTVERVQQLAMFFMEKSMSDQELAVSYATPFLRFMGNMVFGWLLADQAACAHDKLAAIYAARHADTPEARAAVRADHDDARYYAGKVATARFFHTQLLPENRAIAQSILGADRTVLDFAF